ncbi:MAG: hypothetical protein NTZ80_00680 [Patescibacteria group bacterium]|nr:hypothetical protein [Patescibacteria group bacterium]
MYPHPYITILYAISFLAVSLIGFLVIRNNPRSRSNQLFLIYCISTAIWIAAWYIAGQYAFIGQEIINAKIGLFFYRVAFATAGVTLPSMFLFFHHYSQETKPLNWILKYLIYGTGLFLLVASFTPYVHKSLVIENGIYVADEFGSLFSIYFLIFQIYLICTFILAFYKAFHARGIERKKRLIAASGFALYFLFAFSTIVVLPLFDIYVFQNESVAFTLFFCVSVLYSVVKYRFLDVKFTISRIFKIISTLICAIVTSYLLLVCTQFFFGKLPSLLTSSLITVYSAIFLFSFFKLHIFYRVFGITSAEYFRKVVLELQSENIMRSTLREFEKSMRDIFHDRLEIESIKIILLHSRNRKKYHKLISQFASSSEILVTKEIKFLSNEKGRHPALRELEKLGEVCLPLFSPSHRLMAFFVLGKKAFDDPYTHEEIKAIGCLSHFLSTELISVLHKSELKEEVTKKTKDLRNMLEQQNDFIATSAHELRTPLTIALIKHGNLMDQVETLPEEAKAYVKSVNKSLERLKELTQQLFEVQQMEAGRAKLNLEPVSATVFFLDVCNDFSPVFEKENLELICKNNLAEDISVKLDPVRMKQA